MCDGLGQSEGPSGTDGQRTGRRPVAGSFVYCDWMRVCPCLSSARLRVPRPNMTRKPARRVEEGVCADRETTTTTATQSVHSASSVGLTFHRARERQWTLAISASRVLNHRAGRSFTSHPRKKGLLEDEVISPPGALALVRHVPGDNGNITCR